MRLTKPVEAAMAGSVATPVIVKTSRERLPDLADFLYKQFNMFGMAIPRFGMFATVLPNEVIDEIKRYPAVEAIFYDRELRIPEIKGGSISFDPIRRLLLKAREVTAQRAFTRAKPGWTPTSQTRNVLEANMADLEGIAGQGVKIAVVDTDGSARYTNHPQLRGRTSGRTVIEEVSDKNGHGGHCSTTAFGGEVVNFLNGMKACGVAPKATGIGIKVLRGPVGMGQTSDVIKGIEAAEEWGSDVINLSLGGPPTQDFRDDPMFDVFEEIKGKIISCVAIGNEGPDSATTSAPGSLPNVLSVGAVDIHGNIAPFSSRGPTPDGRVKPDVVAPGVNIWSGITHDTYLDYVSDYLANGYTAISGTSMATPHVTGLIALAIQLFRTKLPEVKLTTDLVLSICSKYGQKNNDYGWGQIKYSWFRSYVEEKK